jgi:hypothetical protein
MNRGLMAIGQAAYEAASLAMLKPMFFVRDAWSRRGQEIYGDRSGKRGIRTSLIAGKRGKQLLAPVLFQGSTDALWFNQWLEEHLIPELKPNSTLILDNAPFHRKDDVFRIALRCWSQSFIFASVLT